MTNSTLQSTEGVNQQDNDNWPACLVFSKYPATGIPSRNPTWCIQAWSGNHAPKYNQISSSRAVKYCLYFLLIVPALSSRYDVWLQAEALLGLSKELIGGKQAGFPFVNLAKGDDTSVYDFNAQENLNAGLQDTKEKYFCSLWVWRKLKKPKKSNDIFPKANICGQDDAGAWDIALEMFVFWSWKW